MFQKHNFQTRWMSVLLDLDAFTAKPYKIQEIHKFFEFHIAPKGVQCRREHAALESLSEWECQVSFLEGLVPEDDLEEDLVVFREFSDLDDEAQAALSTASISLGNAEVTKWAEWNTYRRPWEHHLLGVWAAVQKQWPADLTPSASAPEDVPMTPEKYLPASEVKKQKAQKAKDKKFPILFPLSSLQAGDSILAFDLKHPTPRWKAVWFGVVEAVGVSLPQSSSSSSSSSSSTSSESSTELPGIQVWWAATEGLHTATQYRMLGDNERDAHTIEPNHYVWRILARQTKLKPQQVVPVDQALLKFAKGCVGEMAGATSV